MFYFIFFYFSYALLFVIGVPVNNKFSVNFLWIKLIASYIILYAGLHLLITAADKHVMYRLFGTRISLNSTSIPFYNRI